MSDEESRAEQLKSDLLLCTVYASRLLRSQSRKQALGGSELSVLNNLEHWGGSRTALTQKALASHEGISQAAVSNLVKSLTESGLVRSKKNPDDSRSTLVSLTAKGKKQLAAHGRALRSVFDPLLDQLSEEEFSRVADAQAILARTLRHSVEIQSLVTGTASGKG